MSRAHRKPADPQEIMRLRAERSANEAEIGRLRGLGADVTLDRARRIVTAYRLNPFHKLRDSDTISVGQAGAAQQLCEDWAIWKGLDGKPERVMISGDGHNFGAVIVTERMLKAGRRVRRVLKHIGPLDRVLLEALVRSVVEDDRPASWRAIVARVTGFTQSVRQSQTVVCALENLARAYATAPVRDIRSTSIP
jgi:hypothetical protein